MDLADVQTDLQALRKLYSLLQRSSNEILDERAKLLLKNLLDGATEKVLESSSKIIAAAESDFSKAEKFSVVPEIKSSKTDSNCSIFISRKDELSLTKRTPETVVSGSSGFDKVSNRKKRCGFCEGRRMKQQCSARKPGKVAAHGDKINYRYVKKQDKESGKNNLTPCGKMIKETQRNPSDAEPILELEKKSGNASMEVSNSIRWIEPAISSSKSFSHLNVECVRNGQSKKSNSSDNHIIANSQQVSQRTTNNVNSTQQMSQRTSNNVNSTQQVSRRTLNNVNSTWQPDQIVRKNVERKELLRPSASRNDHLAEEPLKLQKRKEDKTSSVKSISSIMRPTLLGADRDSNINQMRRHMDEGSSADGSESVTSSGGSTQKTCSSTNNDSDNKANSLLHRRFADMGNKSSSGSEESSSASPTRKYRFDHHANPEAGIGRLRRLKNKFRFIFHHHHHHHHHHHKYKDYDSDDSGHSKVHYINPKWKHLPNIFPRENKKEVYGKQGFEKLEKSRAIMRPNKNQANYFHTIMEGLRRHVRNSKKPKAGRGRNSVNKLQWWQKFKRNGGVKLKLGKKGRMRLGLKSKNHCPKKLR